MNSLRTARSVLSIFFILAAFALAFLPSVSFADDSTGGTVVPSNFNILEKVAKDSIDELLSNVDENQIGNGIVLVEKSKGIGDVDFVFENMLVKEMKQKGFRIALGSDHVRPQNTSAFKFSYQLIRFSIRYPEITRKYWLGAKKVKRQAEADVFAKLIDLKSGDVVWVGESEKKYKDEIAHSLLDMVEDKQYAFTMPERKEVKWSKLAEPVVVTGIVAGLVYLFFSNQNNE